MILQQQNSLEMATCSRGYPGPQTMPKYRINKTTDRPGPTHYFCGFLLIKYDLFPWQPTSLPRTSRYRVPLATPSVDFLISILQHHFHPSLLAPSMPST